MSLGMINTVKLYHGRIPACGVFCGGCPTYTRENKPCPGAEINEVRCAKCKTFVFLDNLANRVFRINFAVCFYAG